MYEEERMPDDASKRSPTKHYMERIKIIEYIYQGVWFWIERVIETN